MSVTIGGDSTLAIGATLKVILENSSNSFQLKQGDNAIAYAIKKDGSALSTGSEVLTWTEGEAVPAAATLNLEVTGTIDGLPYGSYTDTLTFKATVSGIYITAVKGLHGNSLAKPAQKKKGWFKRQVDKLQEKAGAKPLK